MFSGLILACNLTLTDCGVLVSTAFFDTEEACMASIPEGIAVVEDQGGYVQEYRCVSWGIPV